MWPDTPSVSVLLMCYEDRNGASGHVFPHFQYWPMVAHSMT
jgi:hypothetical protein